MASTGPPPQDTCQSCGAPDDDLEPVHRVYLTMDEDGTVDGSSTVAAVERWCRSCRGTYPHEPA
ncbi:MAG TPA: hypothetical protein VMB72_05925 [Acidimicrobiales bacterium]|nr:hypothetical protein [Acidimicrobiales bacterium]